MLQASSSNINQRNNRGKTIQLIHYHSTIHSVESGDILELVDFGILQMRFSSTHLTNTLNQSAIRKDWKKERASHLKGPLENQNSRLN